MTTDGDQGPADQPSGPGFRDLHPVGRVFAVLLAAVVTVVVGALLVLGGRWGWHLFMLAWNATGD